MPQPASPLASVAAFALLACGAAKDQGAVGIEHVTPTPRVAAKRPVSRTQRLFAASSADRLFGPFVARGAAGRNLVAWVDSGEGGTRRIRDLVTDDGGVPIEPARELVAAAGDVTALVVKRAGGDGASTLLVWTAQGERGEAVRLMGVGDDGNPSSPPVDLARSSDDVVWIEAVRTDRGAVVLWAEETRDGKANVLGVAVDGRGKPRGVPSFLARSVVGWDAATTTGGVALALLSEPLKRKDTNAGFALGVLRIDEDGRALGAPIPVVSEPSVQPDFEMVRTKGGLLFAWTDRSGLEPEVRTAIVDDRQRVGTPARVGPEGAGARLVALAALGRGAMVAYEEPSRRTRVARRVLLTRVGEDAAGAAPAATIEIEGKGPPEIVAAGEGAVILGRMRLCERADNDETCAAAAFVPAALELDANLGPVRVERIEHGSPPSDAQLAWGLSCTKSCMTLALGEPEGEGQAVLAAPLFTRPGTQRASVAALYAPGRPRPRSFTTVLRTDPVADIALARAAAGTLTAVVTRGDEASAAKNSSSSIYLVPVEKDGKVASAVPLGARAVAAAGVSLAPAADATAVVAWASREDGGARVKLARVSPAGKKLTEVIVTTKRGDVSFVNVAAVEGGFIVAWVDMRDGNGEVYAAKVTSDLSRVSEHQRLTSAPGDASDLALIAHPSGVAWLAWSDPREGPREGRGDIYALSIRAKDARKASEEVRVLASAAHSRSPSLAVAKDGVAIGWVEEAPIGVDTDGHAAYGAMLSVIDARGHAVREAIRLRGAGRGSPVGIALDPDRAGARGVLVRSTKDELALDAFTIDGDRVTASWLLTPEGPATLDLPLTLEGGQLVFAEEGRGPTEHRVRRISLEWP